MAKFITAVRVVCRNDNNEILMVQEGKDHVHGHWDLPGGGLEHDESIPICAVREVQEETGYEIDLNGFYGVYTSVSHTTDLPVLVFLFEAEIISDGEPDNHFEGEILDYRFFDPEELESLELRKDNRMEMLRVVEEEKPLPVDRLRDLR